MKKVCCNEFGPPENLQRIEVDTPVPQAGEALISISAAGVGFVDGLMVQGLYQVKPPLPYYPGSEFAGMVSAVGESVTHVKPGDRVLGMATNGAYADSVSAVASSLVKLPANLADAIAAGKADVLEYGSLNATTLPLFYDAAFLELCRQHQHIKGNVEYIQAMRYIFILFYFMYLETIQFLYYHHHVYFKYDITVFYKKKYIYYDCNVYMHCKQYQNSEHASLLRTLAYVAYRCRTKKLMTVALKSGTLTFFFFVRRIF